MPIVLLRLPDIKPTPQRRPRKCPYCDSPILQRWGRVSKAVRDTTHQVAEVHRYRCYDCKRTFRSYPEGVDRSNQTQRMRHLAALTWAMGLSCRDVVAVFKELGVDLSRMTVWRDGKELAARLEAEGNDQFGQAYAIDRAFPHNLRLRFGVVIAIDLGEGKRVILGRLDEHNPRQVKTWLEPMVKEIDGEVAVLGTDMLNQLQAQPV